MESEGNEPLSLQLTDYCPPAGGKEEDKRDLPPGDDGIVYLKEG